MTINRAKQKALVTQERNVRTYAELWHASSKVLEKGIRDEVGSSWQFLASIVLTAFAFEAYLNHVGAEAVVSWQDSARLPLFEKLELICSTLNVTVPGKHSRPMQTVVELFKFRNTLAHGKTETIKAEPKYIDVENVDTHFNSRLPTHWEKLIKGSGFAERAREDVEQVIRLIHDARPEPKEYPFTSGLGTGSATTEY
jgi:hypothetical protein